MAFLRQLAFEFKAGLRDKSLLLMNYLFPLIFFALMGSLMGAINPGFKATMIPAMSLFALMCAFLLAAPSNLVTARDSGLLRSYRINGVPIWAVIAAPPLANLLHLALVTGVIAVVGSLVFGASLPVDWPWFCLVWLATAASLATLGTLIGTLAMNPRAAILISQLVYIPSIMLGGLMMPPSVLPSVLGKISLLFPASHAMRAFAGGPGSTLSLGLLVAGAVLSLGASLALYEWDPKNGRPARRKLLGLIALAPYALGIFL